MFSQNFHSEYYFALMITIIPAIFLLMLFYFRDKIKEPLSMVLSTFAMAFIITLPLDLLILLVDPILLSLFDNQFYYSFDSFFRAAYLEEFLKFTVLYFYVAKHYEF
ncbi:MAG: PrsW family glutamic-type intramembrane protease, partial [SAR202 cluster bacterium]|nr:PrsW family glutamic-type intramembrane protease [SAR202 cluster bacterium]